MKLTFNGQPHPPVIGVSRTPSPWTLQALVSQLGLQTRLNLDGSVHYNEPLVQQIVSHGGAAIPALESAFWGLSSIPALVEGLYAATKLAEARTPHIGRLSQSLIRWNSHPDPVVQIHLARFYRQINEPNTFGPMLSTLVNQAVQQYATQATPVFNISAETGHTVLEQIAQRTADATVQRLVPYLQPFMLQQSNPNPRK